MARSFTGTELIDMAKDLSDHESSSTLSAAQWLSWLSSSWARYHARFVKTGTGFVEGVQTITGTGALTYALPSDYFGTTSVSFDAGSGYIPLEHISVLSRDSYAIPNGGGQAIAWRRAGSYLELLPAPGSGSYRHIYQTGVSRITSAATSLSFDLGFEELLVLDMAIRAKMKEEVSTSDLRSERDALLGELEEALAVVTWGESPSIVDPHEEIPLPGDYPRKRVI